MSLLAGIKVVEVAIYAFVPSTGAALADWGADVVKVEHPETGDPMRGLSSYGISPGMGGVTALWEVFNRGKRSIGIDIASEAGRELLLKLIDEADVFITNFMGPARKKLGIDVDDILARNPRIIYGRGTGQGPVGPDADKGGFDALSYWGRPGVSTAAMPPDYDFPVMLPGPAFGDVQSGMNLAGGIAAALYQRERTGKGALVDVSLLSSGLWAMQATIAGAYVRGTDNIVQLDRYRPPNPLANIYKAKDDRFFLLGMLEADRYWGSLCEAFGVGHLAQDDRFGSMGARAKHSEQLVALLDDIFSKMEMEEIARRLNSQEGQWSTIQMPREAVDDVQSLENGYIKVLDYEGGGKLPVVPVPALVDGVIPAMRRAPEHGEHTDEILLSLGCSDDELVELKISGAIS